MTTNVQKLEKALANVPMGLLQRELVADQLRTMTEERAAECLRLLEEAEAATKKAMEAFEDWHGSRK